MSFKERLTKIIPKTLILAVGAVGLSGCGGNGSEYKECSTDWSYGQESLANPSQAYENLQGSVAQLRRLIIEKAGVDSQGFAVGYAGDDLESVAPDVFRKLGMRYDMGLNTLVDVPAEAICYTNTGGKKAFYFTPQAKAAIGSMETVGIKVEINKGE